MRWWRRGGDPAVNKAISSDPGYRTAHRRIQTTRGKAADYPCAHCPEAAREWAYDFTDPDPRRLGRMQFSLDTDRYMPLCRSCHLKWDLRRRFHVTSA